MEKLRNYLTDTLYRFGQRLKKNPHIRAFFYKFKNEKLFGNVGQHERMLADKVRVDTYYAAIKKHVSESDRVVDLGSGTGILSFFASQNNPKKIHAIDHGDIIELAKFLAKKNGINNIDFFQAHSNQFVPEEKIDIIIHEQIGDFLVDEDMIRNIGDLRDRVLVPGGRILPHRFDLFLEPVSLNEFRRTPFLWGHEFYGINYEGTREWLQSDLNKIGSTKPYQRLLPGDVSHLLSVPSAFFSVDLLTVDPNKPQKKFAFTKEITNAGLLDGFCLYFYIHFDEELSIKTDPFSTPTHWANQLFRVDAQYCKKGDRIRLEMEMEDYTKVSSWRVKHTITRAAEQQE